MVSPELAEGSNHRRILPACPSTGSGLTAKALARLCNRPAPEGEGTGFTSLTIPIERSRSHEDCAHLPDRRAGGAELRGRAGAVAGAGAGAGGNQVHRRQLHRRFQPEGDQPARRVSVDAGARGRRGGDRRRRGRDRGGRGRPGGLRHAHRHLLAGPFRPVVAAGEDSRWDVLRRCRSHHAAGHDRPLPRLRHRPSGRGRPGAGPRRGRRHGPVADTDAQEYRSRGLHHRLPPTRRPSWPRARAPTTSSTTPSRTSRRKSAMPATAAG